MKQLILDLVLLIVINVALAVPTISLLLKREFYKTNRTEGVDVSRRNPLYYNFYQQKLDNPTPGSFGVVLIINLAVVVFLGLVRDVGQVSPLLPVIVGLIIFWLMGLKDDSTKYFQYLKLGRWGMRARYRLLIQLVTFFICLYLINPQGNLFVLTVYTFGAVFLVNSYNILDGMDGLAGGVGLIVAITLATLEYFTYGLGFNLQLLLVIISFLAVFLVFNVNPARVFMGDVGSMFIGFGLAYFATRYNLLLMGILMALILVQGTSSLVQIISLKLFRRKVLSIAPLHLTLLNINISRAVIVRSAWIIQIFLSLITIYLSHYLI